MRTELDTPMSWVLLGIGVMLVPVFFIYLTIIEQVTVTLFMALIMVVAGFLFSAVAGYMAGLVGKLKQPDFWCYYCDDPEFGTDVVIAAGII